MLKIVKILDLLAKIQIKTQQQIYNNTIENVVFHEEAKKKRKKKQQE